MSFPTTNIGGVELSRMLCGSNPFFGYSHFSAAKDSWLKRYFTLDRIVQILARCAEHGINGVVSGPVPEMHQALARLHHETDVHMNWICTPGGQTLQQVLEGVRWCADHYF